MTSFRVAVEDLQFVGQDLARPECVVTTASGAVFVSDKRGGIACLGADGQRQFLAGRAVDGFVPNGFSLLRDRSFAVANIGHLGGAWRLMPDGGLIPEVIEVDGMALPPTNFVHAEEHDGALRLWVSVSTRLVPREQAFSRDVADGYVVLKDRSDVRIVADGLGFTNEIKIDPTGPGFTSMKPSRAGSAASRSARAATSARARPSPSSARAPSPTASSSTPRAASGSRAWSATACCGWHPTAARR